MQKFVQLYITDIDDAITTSTLHGGSFRVAHVALYKTLHQMLFSLDREVALKIKASVDHKKFKRIHYITYGDHEYQVSFLTVFGEQAKESLRMKE